MKFSLPIIILLTIMAGCHVAKLTTPIHNNSAFTMFADSIVQQNKFVAKAISATEITSNYQSQGTNVKDTTATRWKLEKDISAFPLYRSPYLMTDALYNMALEEMQRAVEPDSTFRTGKEWAGVWTRDISYSIILSMAYLQPEVSKNSLLRKVNKKGRIIQDTGTGGAYPASTDRMIWAVAAWELYKVTGDKDWLTQAYSIIKNSIEDDLQNVYDKATGLVKGESSFLDWREQTYPLWMQPVDIYESECLGTNAVHYQANKVCAQMAELLNDTASASKHYQLAEGIKQGINQHLWMSEKGYYGQYLYGRNYKSLSPRAEALGEALAVLFDIADNEKQKQIIAKTPVVDFGIPCIYPQIPGIPPYHNDAVWPFVQTYWALAAAKAGNETSVLESMSAIYRPAGLFLTNKENFVATTGDYAGTQINSSNMLWSLSGNLALVHKILFGIRFQQDGLTFEPFVPEALKGKRTLRNFKYRNAILNIEMQGFGNTVKYFELDELPVSKASISSDLEGTHNIKIMLGINPIGGEINKEKNYTALASPAVRFADGSISWQEISNAAKYILIKNGQRIATINESKWRVNDPAFAEYQVIAVDKNDVESFASEPVAVNRQTHSKEYQIEKFSPKGFVDITTTQNTNVSIPITVAEAGTYSIDFRYANGNGPINTENKCAIRTLKEGSNRLGTIVLPQRGVNNWSEWGYTNPVQVYFEKGTHTLTLSYEPVNENMNGEINQALIDNLRVTKLP